MSNTGSAPGKKMLELVGVVIEDSRELVVMMVFNFRMNCMAFPLDNGVETVLVIGLVFYNPNGTIGFMQ